MERKSLFAKIEPTLPIFREVGNILWAKDFRRESRSQTLPNSCLPEPAAAYKTRRCIFYAASPFCCFLPESSPVRPLILSTAFMFCLGPKRCPTNPRQHAWDLLGFRLSEEDQRRLPDARMQTMIRRGR